MPESSMRALSAAELLSVWERGIPQPPLQRALTLLASACPETSSEALAELSIGQRDAALMTLREWSFGAGVTAVAACPACAERVELSFDLADVRVQTTDEPLDLLDLRIDGYELRVRLPTSLDLMAVADAAGAEDARRRLLSRCVVAARRAGRAVSASRLPSRVVAALAERMAAADPQADVRVAVACPACEHRWLITFDILPFFWREIERWADRMLRDVHVLASAYGWDEAAILALDPYRRQRYLELVQA